MAARADAASAVVVHDDRAAVVSIVVTTYTLDRLKDVCELLDTISGQSYPHIETIFVGETSHELCDRVRAHVQANSISNVKVVFNDRVKGLSGARNVALCHAHGDIIAFVDDDVLLSPDWAEELVKTYASYNIAIGVTGAALPAWQGESMAWFPKEFYWIISCTGWFQADGVRPVRNAWGMNMSFRREAFHHCRFDEALGGNMGAVDGSKMGLLGEDTQISLKLRNATGRPIVYNPTVKVWHKVYGYRLRSRFIRRRAFWEGYTKAWLKRLYRKGDVMDAADLATEYELMRHIMFGFFPSLLRDFVGNPIITWRRFRLAADVLLHVALGYASALLPVLGEVIRRRYGPGAELRSKEDRR